MTMAPHSSTLAWKIPWAEEPGGLQSMGSRRVGHNWTTSLSLFTFLHWRRKWPPTPVFLPGDSQGRGSLVGCCLWGWTESDTTEAAQQQQQQQDSIVCIYRASLFIHLLMDALVISICWQLWITLLWTSGWAYPFRLMFLFVFCFYARSGLAGPYGSSILLFWETSVWFSTVAAPVHVPTNSVEGSLFSTPSPTLVICRLFDDDHSDKREVAPHCGSDL